MMRRFIFSVIGCCIILGITCPLRGEDTSGMVAEVRIEGSDQLPKPAVMVQIKTRARQKFDLEMLREDKLNLLKTGRYSKVDVTYVQSNQGIIVTFTLGEKQLVTKIEITGVKDLKLDNVRSKLTITSGDPADSARISDGKTAIEEYYRSEGFPFVDVNVSQDGGTVTYQVVEGPRVTVSDIEFEGNTYFKTLNLQMKTETWKRHWPIVSGYLDTEKVDRDVLTLKNMYVNDGFLDVEVAALLKYSDDKKTVTVVFAINENQRYRVGHVIFEGNKVFASEELAKHLNLTEGEYYTADGNESDTKIIRTTYGRLGYIEAQVTPEKRFKTEPGLVDLIYKIEEADQYHIGLINIRGNNVTQSRVIRRSLMFYPEQLYNTVAVEQSKRRLMELGLFEDVQITPVGNAANMRDVLVSVKEGRTAEFLIGVGVSSNSGLLGNISYRQRNFDITNWPDSWKQFLTLQGFKGAGQTFAMVAEPGTELMRYSIEWFEPMLFDQPYSLGAKVYGFERDRNEYTERRIGSVFSLGHRFKNRWYGELATRVEGIRVDDVDAGSPIEITQDEGSHFLVGFKGSLVRDRTDSRWTPSEGDRLRFSAEPVSGDYNFTSLEADYRWYKTISVDSLDRKHIFAARTSAGYLAGDTPVFERFYGGGIGSVRGFEYRGISPRKGLDPKPIGGEFMLFAGCEYSFPLVGRQLRGVVFLDTGTVEEDFEVTTYRASVGVGLRWIVPMFGQMPMSFDFAAPIAKDSEDDTQIFSFSLGWTF